MGPSIGLPRARGGETGLLALALGRGRGVEGLVWASEGVIGESGVRPTREDALYGDFSGPGRREVGVDQSGLRSCLGVEAGRVDPPPPHPGSASSPAPRSYSRHLVGLGRRCGLRAPAAPARWHRGRGHRPPVSSPGSAGQSSPRPSLLPLSLCVSVARSAVPPAVSVAAARGRIADPAEHACRECDSRAGRLRSGWLSTTAVMVAPSVA